MILPPGAQTRQIDLGRCRLQVVEAGPLEAPALLLLHGWPEFWGSWVRTIPALAERYRVIAPDLRGFGASADGQMAESVSEHAEDQLALLDALGVVRAGVVGHDVGAQVAQAMALAAPARIAGLFFGNCPYPGIGRRWAAPDRIPEIWYQSFNQQPWAADLVGQSRESVRLYIGHFLSHWAGDPSAFDDVLEDWVDAYLQPGALEGGFAWYRAVDAARRAQIADGPQPRPPIAVPARVFWGGRDPLLPAAWTEGLSDYFTEIEIEIAEDAGHFVFFEVPEAANPRLLAFFDRRRTAGTFDP
ncbi:MAG: alpha/beta hydrolase [Pseudomonadota bacterium]